MQSGKCCRAFLSKFTFNFIVYVAPRFSRLLVHVFPMLRQGEQMAVLLRCSGMKMLIADCIGSSYMGVSLCMRGYPCILISVNEVLDAES
jgi:hypothetical protein